MRKTLCYYLKFILVILLGVRDGTLTVPDGGGKKGSSITSGTWDGMGEVFSNVMIFSSLLLPRIGTTSTITMPRVHS